jgi:hypothetical protein
MVEWKIGLKHLGKAETKVYRWKFFSAFKAFQLIESESPGLSRITSLTLSQLIVNVNQFYKIPS